MEVTPCSLPLEVYSTGRPEEEIKKYKAAEWEEKAYSKIDKPMWFEIGFLEGIGWIALFWKYGNVTKQGRNYYDEYDVEEDYVDVTFYSDTYEDLLKQMTESWMKESNGYLAMEVLIGKVNDVVKNKDRKGKFTKERDWY